MLLDTLNKFVHVIRVNALLAMKVLDYPNPLNVEGFFLSRYLTPQRVDNIKFISPIRKLSFLKLEQ